MKRLPLVAAATVLGAGVAHADIEQTPLDPLDPTRIVSPLTLVQGNGVKIGEGTSIYPQVGLETGYESNTFYTNDNPIGAGILRVLVEAGIGSLSKQRLGVGVSDGAVNDTDSAPHGSVVYEANAYAAYDQYLSGNDNVTSQSGVALGFRGNVLTNPDGAVSFYANDGYDRVLRPMNFESNINSPRDINNLLLRVDIHPQGRRLGGSIGYVNQIDVFERDTQYPDRLHNTLIGRLNYNVFPLTTTFVQVSGSYFTGIGGAAKVTSFPLVAVAGVSTAVTVKTSLLAEAGYTQGFYESGPSYQAFAGNVYFEYRYSPISALRLRYAYEHQDSINANFFRDHVFQAWIEHKVDPIGIFVSPELRLREYDGLNAPLMGPPVRNDVIFAAAAGLRYQFREWITASAQYRFVDDSTDYRYTSGTMVTNPSYLRHEVYAGVRVAY